MKAFVCSRFRRPGHPIFGLEVSGEIVAAGAAVITFLIAGGVIETREFQSPQDVASVPQRVIINCPGYGGKSSLEAVS